MEKPTENNDEVKPDITYKQLLERLDGFKKEIDELHSTINSVCQFNKELLSRSTPITSTSSDAESKLKAYLNE